MRANEFVADKLILESLLTEEFSVIKLTPGYGEGFGVFDAEGKLVREFSNEADAKKFMDQKNAELRSTGGDAGKPGEEKPNKKFTIEKLKKWPLEIFKYAAKWSTWATLITIIQGVPSTLQALDTFEAYHEFLRTTDICDKEYKIRNLPFAQRKLVQDYVTDVSNELTDGILTTLTLALTVATIVANAGKLIALIPGPGWVGGLLLTIGTPILYVIIERFLENNSTAKTIRKWITRTFVNPMFTDSRYIKRVCDDRLPNWEQLPLVKNIPGVNESQSIADNEVEAEFMSIWNDVAQDPRIQKYIKEWERNPIIP